MGGTIEDSRWNEMPDKPIKSIEYSCLEKTFVLENYLEYNHIVERKQIINKPGEPQITKILLMTRTNENTLIIIFDFIKNTAYPTATEINKEYMNKPVTGWKKGIVGQKPNIKFIS